MQDVIVVGAGPCGSFAALNIAKKGANVTVFEEHETIGIPAHCAGHLSIKGLKNLGLYPLPAKVVENTFYGATFHSPRGRNFSVRFSKPVTCVVNRTSFDRYIAKTAEDNGAKYELNSRVESLIIDNNFVKGVRVKQNGKVKEYLAKIVIDAEGITSRILKYAGLTGADSHLLVNGVEAEVDNIKDVEMDMVEVFLGNSYAPGFYAWLIPKHDKTAKLGLAVKKGNPKEALQRFMRHHPVAAKKLQKAKILKTNFHVLTLGGPAKRAYSNGFLVIGDTASQVKPTTGGGIVLGLTCARTAAEVACEALRKNDFSADFLSQYQKRFMKILGFDTSIMLLLRKTLNTLSDEKLEKIIQFCTKMSLNEKLQSFEELDFQGKALVNALTKPKILAPLIFVSFFCLPEILKSQF